MGLLINYIDYLARNGAVLRDVVSLPGRDLRGISRGLSEHTNTSLVWRDRNVLRNPGQDIAFTDEA